MFLQICLQYWINITRHRYRFKLCTCLILISLYFLFYLKHLVSTPSIQMTNFLHLQLLDQVTPQCILPHFPSLRVPKSNIQLQCKDAKTNWVKIHNGKFYINQNISSMYPGGVACSYIPVERLDDYFSYFGEAQTNFANGGNLSSDYFYANCNSADEKDFYEMMHAGICPNMARVNEAIRVIDNPASLNYNVVLLGIDSVSKLSFSRNLPKSYDIFTEQLGGVVFNKFNIIGDGTTANLLALLTGRKETELPEARRNHANGKMVDDYPWIWNTFKKAGYLTQWAEDGAKYGTFQYRLRGFKNQPTDHYMRTFFLKAEETYSKHYWGCLGSQSRHMVMLNWLREYYRVYNSSVKKFSLIFHSELSHEDNQYLAPLDSDLVDLLDEFQDGKLFNKTILILFSDHGHRYAKTRSTFQGKYEERLPFLGVLIPKSLRNIRPDIVPNLKGNADTLVTLLDVHATLHDILNHSYVESNSSYSQRSKSLFKPLPANRSCQSVMLDAHWCVCLQWRPLLLDNRLALRVSHFLIDRINKIFENHRNLCSNLSLKKLESAELYAPPSALLMFKKSNDNDGRQAEFSDKMRATQEVYRVNVLTEPGDASFEGTIYKDLVNDVLNVQVEDISRTNRYAHQIGCLNNAFPELTKYCICKNKSNNNV